MNIQAINRNGQVQSGKNKQNRKKGRKMNRSWIRPFEKADSDYESVVAIVNANYADSPISLSEFRFRDDTWDAKYLHKRLVAERAGQIVGFATFGQPSWSFREGKFFFEILVYPEWRGEGVAEQLLDAVMAKLDEHEPTYMTSELREDQGYVVDLLLSRGYEAVMRFPVSELAVQSFDAERFAESGDRVRESGIRIDSLGTIAAEDPAWKQKLYDLEWEILQDVPFPEPLTKKPFDEWHSRVLEDPNFLIEAQIIAMDGDQYVGMSGLWGSEADPKKLYTGLTGVLRPYRRRGIATVLKVEGIKFAQAKGIKVIDTDNEENNPMLDLNKQLGYTEKPAYVSYEKDLKLKEPVKEYLKIPV